MKHLPVLTSDLFKLAHFLNSLWDQELLTSHTGNRSMDIWYSNVPRVFFENLSLKKTLYNV